MLWDYGSTAVVELRRKIRVVVLGSVTGYGFPTVLMLIAGLTGGQLAVNYAAFTLFVFPLSIAYVLVKQDLLRIEMLLRQSASALASLAFIALCLGSGNDHARAAVPYEPQKTVETTRYLLDQPLSVQSRNVKMVLPVDTQETHIHSSNERGGVDHFSWTAVSGVPRHKDQAAPDKVLRAFLTAFDSTNFSPARSLFLNANTALR
jgi:hypothetical protein